MAIPSIKQMLKKGSAYKVTGSLWIECESERFFGPGRVELLERINDHGSINKAAKQMRMSYKKAWEMIGALNAKSTNPLVVTKAGGKKGGGSVLTPEAIKLINYHQLLRERFLTFLENETRQLKE